MIRDDLLDTGTKSIKRVKKKSQPKEKACDQCNKSHIRCDRQEPVCQSCIRRDKKCTWEREPIFRTNHAYQNIETFSLEKSKEIFKPAHNRHLQINHYSHYFLLDKSWKLILRKWIHTSHGRIFFNYFVNISSISLDQASKKERDLLGDVLLNKIGVMPIERRMKLQLDFRLFNILNHLQIAQEAFFHYFNPFYTLFTKHGYDSYPRSWLLKFTVWRTGLQFLPDSLLNRLLMDHIDLELIKATHPSKLIINLDTLQSYLILMYGLIYSRILQRLFIFNNTVLSLAYALGLHIDEKLSIPLNVKLERKLAYRVVVLLDVTCVYTLGLSSQISIDLSYSSISNATLDYYFTRLEYLNTETYGEIWGLNSANSLDFCSLITSECLYLQCQILAQINSEFQAYLKETISVETLTRHIYLALSELFKQFFKYIDRLNNFRKLYKLKVRNPIHYFPLQAFDQMICYLAIQYHYSRLLVLSIATRITLTNSSKPTSYYLKNGPYFITSGILSAFKLIRLLSRVGLNPFNMMKICYSSTASHFIIRNFHEYCHNYVSHQRLDIYSLKSVLREARSQMVASQTTFIFSYQAPSNMVLFDALLAYHNVII